MEMIGMCRKQREQCNTIQVGSQVENGTDSVKVAALRAGAAWQVVCRHTMVVSRNDDDEIDGHRQHDTTTTTLNINSSRFTVNARMRERHVAPGAARVPQRGSVQRACGAAM